MVSVALAPVELSATVRQPSTPALRAMAELVGGRYRIDPRLLEAIAIAESNNNPLAVSPKGALGLMQIMPETARRFGVREPERELADPLTSLDVAAAYLKTLQGQFGNNLPLVLAAYNAGEGAVLRHGRRMPPYKETRLYVAKILDRYSRDLNARLP